MLKRGIMGDPTGRDWHPIDERTKQSPVDRNFRLDVDQIQRAEADEAHDDPTPSDEAAEVTSAEPVVEPSEKKHVVKRKEQSEKAHPGLEVADDRDAAPISAGKRLDRSNSMAVVKENIEDTEEDLETVEAQEKKYLEARDRLVKKTQQLRADAMKLNEQVMRGKLSKEDFKDAVDGKIEDLAGLFSHEERMLVLKKALKDVHIPHEETARMKFEFLIGLSLKMKYWDRDNFVHQWDKKAGDKIEAGFEEDRETFVDHLALLESYYGQIENEVQQQESGSQIAA